MIENESKKLPPSKSLDDLVDFFDTHDLGEYWDKMPAADFAVDIKRREKIREQA